MSEIIGNIVVSCGECFAGGVPYVGRYVWFRNQHGARVRVFCYRCGCVTEKVEKKGIVTTELKPWKTTVLFPYETSDEFPF